MWGSKGREVILEWFYMLMQQFTENEYKQSLNKVPTDGRLATFSLDYEYKTEYEYNFLIPVCILRLSCIAPISSLELHSLLVNNME